MTMEGHMFHSSDGKFLNIYHTHQILHRQIITCFNPFEIICATNNTKTSIRYNSTLLLFSSHGRLISTNVGLNDCQRDGRRLSKLMAIILLMNVAYLCCKINLLLEKEKNSQNLCSNPIYKGWSISLGSSRKNCSFSLIKNLKTLELLYLYRN
jgi:hypothetical protein